MQRTLRRSCQRCPRRRRNKSTHRLRNSVCSRRKNLANKKVNQMSGVTLHVPPGGGPPPHRHDFEETFVLLEGEIEAIRGNKRVVRAGQTIKVPANTPHQFHNYSSKPVRMLCICSPSGQEEFFKEVGVPVTTRTTPPPKPG